MDATSRRQILVDKPSGIAFVAEEGLLGIELRQAGLSPSVDSEHWFLVQTDDANENANLFFQATFGKPESVGLSMRQFGTRIDEESQQEVALVAIEAVAESLLDTDSRSTLEQLGFQTFHQFAYDEALQRQLEQRGLV